MAKLIIVVLSLFFVSVYCGLTPELEKQIADTKKMVQQVCQPKFKIPDTQIEEAMKTKVVPTDKNFKCFIHCTLELTGMMTKNKPNFENARKQVEIFLPDDLKGPILNAMDICSKNAEVVKNPCDTAYNIAVCFQENNPDSPF